MYNTTQRSLSTISSPSSELEDIMPPVLYRTTSPSPIRPSVCYPHAEIDRVFSPDPYRVSSPSLGRTTNIQSPLYPASSSPVFAPKPIRPNTRVPILDMESFPSPPKYMPPPPLRSPRIQDVMYNEVPQSYLQSETYIPRVSEQGWKTRTPTYNPKSIPRPSVPAYGSWMTHVIPYDTI